MSPLIDWDEQLPSDGSAVRAGEIRDIWAALSAGLNESLEWDGTVAGQPRAGTFPSFVTTETNVASLWESAVSSSGRLVFASDTSRLFTLGLSTSRGRAAFAGGPQLLEHIDQVPPGHTWRVGSGASLLATPDGTSIITYHSDGLNSSDALVYETPPSVLITSDSTNYMPITVNIGATNFTARMHPLGAATNVTIRWISSGTSTL